MPRLRDKRKALIASTALVFALVLSVSACGPVDQDGDTQTNGRAQASDAAWSLETDCEQCHTNEAASRSNSACLASLHTGSDCSNCHSDEASLAIEHEGATADAKMPKKLRKTSVGSETCLSCHGSWEELASITADLTVLTDDEGTIVNPHDLPTGHADEKVSCSDCHRMHAEEGGSMAASETCQSCHHKNVYTCNTCH